MQLLLPLRPANGDSSLKDLTVSKISEPPSGVLATFSITNVRTPRIRKREGVRASLLGSVTNKILPARLLPRISRNIPRMLRTVVSYFSGSHWYISCIRNNLQGKLPLIQCSTGVSPITSGCSGIGHCSDRIRKSTRNSFWL